MNGRYMPLVIVVESVAAQRNATATAAIPKAKPVPVLDQYDEAQADYQKELDPAKAAKVNQIYGGASDMDKAKIVSQSLKRNAGKLRELDAEVAAAPRATRLPLSRRI